MSQTTNAAVASAAFVRHYTPATIGEWKAAKLRKGADGLIPDQKTGAANTSPARWRMSEGDPSNDWPSPSWCNYPGASRPVAGCWSLLGGEIKTASDCGDCECRQSAAPADE